MAQRRRTGYKNTRDYAKGGAVKRTGYYDGGVTGLEDQNAYPYGRQEVNQEIDRYYHDPLEDKLAQVRPVAPQGDDTVYGSTKPSWNDDAYNASMMQSQSGYARGGAVRRGYADGGAVPRQNFLSGGAAAMFGVGEWATKSQKAKAAAKWAEHMEAMEAAYGKGNVDPETGDVSGAADAQKVRAEMARMAQTPDGRRQLELYWSQVGDGSSVSHGIAEPVKGSTAGLASEITRAAGGGLTADVDRASRGGTPAAGGKDVTNQYIKDLTPKEIIPRDVSNDTSPRNLTNYRDDTDTSQTTTNDTAKTPDYADSYGNYQSPFADASDYTGGSDGRNITDSSGSGDGNVDVTSYVGDYDSGGVQQASYDGGGGNSDVFNYDGGSGGNVEISDYGPSYAPSSDGSFNMPTDSGQGSYDPNSGGGGGNADGGYARGGVVRRTGYDEGGYVEDESAGLDTSYQGNTEAQNAILREQERQARELAANAARQQSDREAFASRDIEPPSPPPSEPPGAQPSARDAFVQNTNRPQGPSTDLSGDETVAQMTLSDVLAHTRSKFNLSEEEAAAAGDARQAAAARTGYRGASQVDPTAPAQPTGYGASAPPDLVAEQRSADEARQAAAARLGNRGNTVPQRDETIDIKDPRSITPGDSVWDMAKSTGAKIFENRNLPATPKYADLAPEGSMTLKERWSDYLRGGKALPPEEMVKVVNSDPRGDYNAAVQKSFDDRIKAGDTDGASQLTQGLRVPYETLRGMANAALDAGDAKSAMAATKRMHDLLPNGTRMDVAQGPDGNFVVKTTPEAGRAGDARTFNLSPEQFRNFLTTNASQFDHVADNGLNRNLGILTARRMDQPAAPGSPESVMEIRARGGAFNDSGRYERGSPEDRAQQLGIDPERINDPAMRDRLRPPSAAELAAPVPRGVPGPQAGADPTSDADEFSARRRGGGGGRGGGGAGAVTGYSTDPLAGTSTSRGTGASVPLAGPNRGAEVSTIQQTGFTPTTTRYLSQDQPAPSGLQGAPIQGTGQIRDIPVREVGPMPSEQERFGEPGSMRGIPQGMAGALTSAELKYAADRPDRAITKDPDLLQRLPDGYFDTMGGKAAMERIARNEAERGGQYPSGTNGKEALARDLLSLYNPERSAAQEAARAAAPPKPPLNAPTGATPQDWATSMASGKQKADFKVGDFSPENIKAYNERIDQFNPQDPASKLRAREFEQRAAPQYKAASEQRGREAADKEAGIQKQFRAEDEAAYKARERAREDATPQGIAHRRALELQGEKNVPGLAKAEATTGAAQIRADSILTKTDRDNLTKQGIAGDRNQTNRDIATQRTDTQQNIATNRDATKLEGIDRQQAGANQRTTQREAGKDSRLEYTQGQLNQRAENVLRNKEQHQRFLESKAAAEIVLKDVQGTAKEVMGTVRTKIAQGVKLNEQEMDVYQQVLDKAGSAPRTGALLPAADFLRNPDQRVQPQPAAPAGPQPTPQSVEALRANPALRAQFDGFYGPGAAARILGQ